MSTKDRKLLELAAKAAGMTLTLGGYIGASRHDENGRQWNPLTDDGDALRLAVRLGMEVVIDIECEDVCAYVYKPDGKRFYACETAAFMADPYEATRRAIVRTAAEIGKQ